MNWVELSISANAAELTWLTAILAKYGQGGSVIEEEQPSNSERSYIIKAYLPHTHSYRTQKLKLEQDLSQQGKLASALKERRLKPADWLDSLKNHFGILEIGDWLLVKPGWIEKQLPISERIMIQLDPGAAFGTGLHPTTRLCLVSLKKYLQPGMSVLDLGTGSGIIAIAAEKLGASTILALDIDPVAVKAARYNVALNCVSNTIEVKRGSLSLQAQAKYRNSFDLVLANVTGRAIVELSGGFLRVLKSGGKLIVSGIHTEGLDEVLIHLALSGFKLEDVEPENGWYAVIAGKS